MNSIPEVWSQGVYDFCKPVIDPDNLVLKIATTPLRFLVGTISLIATGIIGIAAHTLKGEFKKAGVSFLWILGGASGVLGIWCVIESFKSKKPDNTYNSVTKPYLPK